MTTVSDECERTCPLCAEEMDLTDKQLKPCKCGYEICVWCWHHIMDMAEKDDTEGRCPACRTPYDKEKIVGAAASCERMVVEVNSDRKIKSQKTKPKASEGRKHLSSVRVIQRNLVYVIGIPANLADEDTLEKREYFGQYGKVLKVSITRPSGGGQNSSSNNTVSAYITYTKEDEAVRCIQSVHGFTLDGRLLRACFGTTKYCHTWLRNMPCSNPDCLYLHEVGVQEDSFTKDEIISAYTRSRVQQITGVANNHFQRRAGPVLPPPADDFFCSSGSASVKPNVKNSSSNNSTTQVKVSPPNSSSGRSSVLPPAASWGLRGSNCRPPTASSSCTQGSTKQISDSVTSSVSPSMIPITAPLPTLHSDVNQESTETDRVLVPVYSTGRPDLLELYDHSIHKESQCTGNSSIDASVDTGSTTVTLYGNSLTTPNEQDRGMSTLQEIGLSIDHLGRDHQNFASNHISPEQLGNHPTGFQHYHCDNGFHATEAVSAPLVRDDAMPESELGSREISSWDFDSQTTVIPVASMCDNGGLFAGHSSCLSHSSSQYVQSNKIGSRTYPDDMDSGIASGKVDESSFPNGGSIFVNGYKEHNFNTVSDLGKIFGPSGSSNSLVNAEKEKNVKKVEAGASEIDQNVESSIISSILSLDLDSWDDPLTSSSNFAKMFGESDRQSGSIGLPSPWKQNSQSRFSFARQEDLINQTNHLDPSLSSFAVNVNRGPRETRNFVADKHENGFTANGYEDLGGHFSSQSMSSSRAPAPRAQMSAPPGFSAPNRPPPGFSSQERLYRAFDSTSSGNPLLESSLSRNHYQVGSMGSVGDVELIDPAILAVGKGRLPLGISNSSMNLSTHFPATRNSNDGGDLRLRLLLQQQSLSAHQNYRTSGQMDDGYTTIKDRFITSRLLGQTEENNLSHFSQMSLQSRNQHFSSGQWDSWNEVQNGNEMNGVAEFLRNERVGLNKYYSGYDELKVRMSSSTDLYNRAYGI